MSRDNAEFRREGKNPHPNPPPEYMGRGKEAARFGGALERAQIQARQWNHDFVGTEHLLLAALEDRTAAEIFKTLGLEPAAVRGEIESILPRGRVEPAAGQLPLTPRAGRAIALTQDECARLGLSGEAAEHLLLGLALEPDGVAGKVMAKLGVDPRRLRAEVFKIRIAQFKIVERAVRPVPAAMPRKRKMREELLAHLEAIYAEELTRGVDRAAALEKAARRLGNPEELSKELEQSLTRRDLRVYRSERFFGWQPPETAAHYMGRLALWILWVTSVNMALAASFIFIRWGWNPELWLAIRPLAAICVLIPADLFLIGVSYYTLRDAMWGPPWARKSRGKVAMMQILIGLLVYVTGFIFYGWAGGDLRGAEGMRGVILVWALIVPWIAWLVARFFGPIEIADATWACLDLSNVN